MPRTRVRNMPRHQQKAVFAKLRGKREWRPRINIKVPGPYGTSISGRQTPKIREIKISSPASIASTGVRQHKRGSKTSIRGYAEVDYVVGKKRITKKLD